MFYHQFLTLVKEQPSATAIVAGEERLNYRDLNERVLRFSQALAGLNVEKGSVVATVLPNSLDFIVATLAIFKLGAVLVPLNINYTDDEIKHYLVAAKVNCLVSLDSQQKRLLSLDYPASFISTEQNFDLSQSACTNETSFGESDRAIIMFSSGSTGGAKQICRSYENLLAEWRISRDTINITPDDVILCSVPLHHTHGFGNCFIAAILNGATLVITLGEFNPRTVVKALVQNQVTIYPSATFMLKMLSTIRLKEKVDLSALRLVYSAGAPLDQSVIEDFTSLFSTAPQQLYGSTETGAAALNLGDGPLSSVGKPMAYTHIDIIDEEDNVLSCGIKGEIVISSPSATSAYEGMPEQSAITFRDGRYYTGDIGYLNQDGYLFVTGRKKAMINVAGLKVDPAEVESVLLKMPEISEVVVLGKPDGNYGELVKAVIVSSREMTEKSIIEHSKQYLAEYKWPKNIEFRTEIPKSPLGKILKKYL